MTKQKKLKKTSRIIFPKEKCKTRACGKLKKTKEPRDHYQNPRSIQRKKEKTSQVPTTRET